MNACLLNLESGSSPQTSAGSSIDDLNLIRGCLFTAFASCIAGSPRCRAHSGVHPWVSFPWVTFQLTRQSYTIQEPGHLDGSKWQLTDVWHAARVINLGRILPQVDGENDEVGWKAQASPHMKAAPPCRTKILSPPPTNQSALSRLRTALPHARLIKSSTLPRSEARKVRLSSGLLLNSFLLSFQAYRRRIEAAMSEVSAKNPTSSPLKAGTDCYSVLHREQVCRRLAKL